MRRLRVRQEVVVKARKSSAAVWLEEKRARCAYRQVRENGRAVRERRHARFWQPAAQTRSIGVTRSAGRCVKCLRSRCCAEVSRSPAVEVSCLCNFVVHGSVYARRAYIRRCVTGERVQFSSGARAYLGPRYNPPRRPRTRKGARPCPPAPRHLRMSAVERTAAQMPQRHRRRPQRHAREETAKSAAIWRADR